jgi:flagellar protein FliO/FliZ
VSDVQAHSGSPIRAGRGFARSSAAWAGLALSFVATFVRAAEPFAAPKPAETVDPTSAGSLAQVTLSLILVLAAVFGAAWVMRKLRTFGKFGAGAIEIVADIAVGTKERAVLVQVGKQQILLGVAPGRVNTLHVLSEPVQTPPTPPAPGAGPTQPTPDFKAILKRSLGL